METRLRLLIVHAGLPEPDINRDVISSQGGWLARPDLSYPEWKIAIEYDGDHHRVDPRPAPTLMRILSALSRRGCPGLPPRLRDDWRQL